MNADLDRYHRVFRHLNPTMTTDEWAFFAEGLTRQTLAPRAFFSQAGQLNQQLGFVTGGLVRGYYVNDAGEDITTLFVTEDQWVTDYPSLLLNKPSRYNYQCLEPTTLLTVPFGHIRAGYERFVGFERNGRLIAEAILVEQQRRIESFQFDSAEQRYLTFIREYPALFNRISLTHLASYLGIERPSLSRIRRKVAGL